MQFVAKTRYIRYSPYKLRPLVDVVRGKNVQYALAWLGACRLKKAEPIRKMVASAAANARNLRDISPNALIIKDIRVDEGPSVRSYKPGAMGRAALQRRRYSHMKVVVEPIEQKEA
ncbi:50S ribosomal protein L22 [Candidatus Dependentiae bacterium HGW-Dependentiae-1]|nr:MAG: 50S ribosomal protein L22 [Candidatus Dependentiae bacterium HGW-Dependentiae-1]